jgi:thiol-disulfide isomerase/thioredoxin
MKQICYVFFPLQLLISSLGFSQNISLSDLKGSWYTSDGSNELLLLVTDEFALYQSQFWEINSSKTDRLVLKNSEGELELQLSHDGKSHFLQTGDKKTPIQPIKAVDWRDRAVGTTDVSDKFLQSDQVLLQGIFIPRGAMPKTIKIIYNYAFTTDQKQFTGDVDEKGRFKVIFPLEHPQQVYVRIGDAYFTHYSAPGTKQAMVIDENSFVGEGADFWKTVKDIDYMGHLAVENEERRLLNPAFMKIRDYEVTDSMTQAADQAEFMSYRLNLMDKHEAFYLSYFDSIPVSASVQDISLRSVRTYAGDDLRRYIWMHGGIQNGRLTPVDVSDDYIHKIKSLMPNEWEDLMTPTYAGLIREFSMFIRPSESELLRLAHAQLGYDYLGSLDLSDALKTDLDVWKNVIASGMRIDSMAVSDEFKSLLMSHQDKMRELFFLAKSKLMLQNISDLGSIPRSAILATYLDENFLSVGQEVPASIQSQLDSLQLEPQVLALIKDDIADYKLMRDSRFVAGTVISDNSENVLHQLKTKYPGKVIYVDVWATWCSPCLSEFKNAENIKKQAPEGVVFANVCAQSERNSFETQIKKYGLVGEHFFLEKEEFEIFDKEVSITGFPTYMIISKEGKLIREGVKRPSAGQELVDQLREFTSR